MSYNKYDSLPHISWIFKHKESYVSLVVKAVHNRSHYVQVSIYRKHVSSDFDVLTVQNILMTHCLQMLSFENN